MKWLIPRQLLVHIQWGIRSSSLHDDNLEIGKLLLVGLVVVPFIFFGQPAMEFHGLNGLEWKYSLSIMSNPQVILRSAFIFYFDFPCATFSLQSCGGKISHLNDAGVL
jgi:hypothetical protein